MILLEIKILVHTLRPLMQDTSLITLVSMDSTFKGKGITLANHPSKPSISPLCAMHSDKALKKRALFPVTCPKNKLVVL